MFTNVFEEREKQKGKFEECLEGFCMVDTICTKVVVSSPLPAFLRLKEKQLHPFLSLCFFFSSFFQERAFPRNRFCNFPIFEKYGFW